MTTISTAVPSTANEGVHPHAAEPVTPMRGDGRSISIDIARLREISLEGLTALAEAMTTVDTVLLGIEHFRAFQRPCSDKALAAHGVVENTAAGQYLEEVRAWVSWFADTIFDVILAFNPETRDDVRKRGMALMEREAFLDGPPEEIVMIATRMLADLAAFDRTERRAGIAREPTE